MLLKRPLETHPAICEARCIRVVLEGLVVRGEFVRLLRVDIHRAPVLGSDRRGVQGYSSGEEATSDSPSS